MTRDNTTGIVFSSGWWVSIDLLRNTHLTMIDLAGCVHLSVAQVAEEMHAWATGIGLPFGVNVNVEAQEYECV